MKQALRLLHAELNYLRDKQLLCRQVREKRNYYDEQIELLLKAIEYLQMAIKKGRKKMKEVILMSIQPKWLVKILNGEKTIEIRKTMPKCDLPIDVYLYCTKDIKDILYKYKDKYYTQHYLTFADSVEVLNSKVVAKFTLNKIEDCCDMSLPELEDKSLLNINEICSYIKAKEVDPKMVYAWHIDNLVIFDKPKELSEFEKEEYYSTPNGWFPSFQSLTKAPQSWQYVYTKGGTKMNLTPRQWMFYRYLREQALLNPNRWIDKREIHFALIGEYELNDSPKTHDVCSTMNKDMMDINRSEKIEKLIILKNNKFKIATEAEALEYIEKHRKKIENHAKRINKLVYKLRRNGQYKLLSNDDVPISESQGREYVEAFIE